MFPLDIQQKKFVKRLGVKQDSLDSGFWRLRTGFTVLSGLMYFILIFIIVLCQAFLIKIYTFPIIFLLINS